MAGGGQAHCMCSARTPSSEDARRPGPADERPVQVPDGNILHLGRHGDTPWRGVASGFWATMVWWARWSGSLANRRDPRPVIAGGSLAQAAVLRRAQAVPLPGTVGSSKSSSLIWGTSGTASCIDRAPCNC